MEDHAGLTEQPDDFDEVLAGSGVDTINVQDGDPFDVVCTGGGADTVTADGPEVPPGDVVDDPNFYP